MQKKSIIFRIASMILCGCLMLSLLPGGLFVKALNEISTVSITNVTAPSAGDTPDFDVSVPDDGLYSVYAVAWKDSAGSVMSSSQHFVGGEKYTIAVTVQANDDSVFKQDESGLPLVSSTVNGQSAGYCKEANGLTTDLYTMVSYSFIALEQSIPEQTPISRVSVSGLTVPMTGGAPDFTASTGDNSYWVDSVNWTHLNSPSGSAVTMSGGDRFVAGGQYRVTVILRADSSHSFSSSVTGSLNGAGTACQSVPGRDPGEYIQLTYTYTLAQGNQITHAEITGLTVPVKGNRPDYTVSVLSTAPYTVSEVSWKRWKTTESEEDSVAIGTRETFQNGYCYQVSVTLKAKYGSSFATDGQGKPLVTGTINGEPALPGTSVAGKSATQYVNIRFTYTLEAKIIDRVVIDGVIDPVSGDRPNALASTAEDALYSVTNVTWECYDDTLLPPEYVAMDPYAIFAAGMVYRVNVYLRALDGAEFAVDDEGNSTVTGTINGEEGFSDSESIGQSAQSYICFSYTYPLLKQTIQQVDVSGIEPPEAGKKPDYEADELEEAQYEVEEIIWEHLDTEKSPAEFVKMEPEDKFENYQDYRVTVILRAKAGGIFYVNEFGDLQVTGTINGEPTIPADTVEKEEAEECISIFYDFSLTNDTKVIKRVVLHDLTVPQNGEVPDYKVSTDAIAKYTVDQVIWERMNNRQATSVAETLEDGDVFREGAYYRVKIILKAADGYGFQNNETGRPQVTATLNGGAGMAAERIVGKDARQYVCVSYVYGVYTVIDGGAGQWSPGKGPLRFRFSGDYKNFTGVRVNGVLLADKYYIASEGSTIVELSTNFLDTLQDGIYEISVVYSDGIAVTQFEVTGGAHPKGDDEKTISKWVWILPLAIAVLCGMFAAVIYFKRREEAKVYEEEYEEFYEDDEE